MPRKANLQDLIGQQRVAANRAEVQAGPKYLRLESKDVRFWPGQVSDLDELARELNRERRKQGERITSNTLIRLAAAWLVEHAGDLRGITEEELAASLRLKKYPPAG